MNNKYLANGTIIGGHYKIIDVLGEDDFEILYLAKNIHREGSFFVIKELFLEVFSERKGTNVETIPEALGVFNKRKAEIIREINNLHRRHIVCEIKVFAYFEENGTIYSCMAYTPNAKVEAYLQFEPKKDKKLPLLEELIQIGEDKKKKSSSLWLIGVVLLTLIGGLILAFNQYGNKLKTLNIWNNKQIEVNTTKEKNSTIIQPKNLVEKHHIIIVESNKTKTKEKKDLLEHNISLVNIPKKDLNVTKQKTLSIEENTTKKNIIKKIVDDTNLTKKIVEDANTTKYTQDDNLSKIFSKANIHQFLNSYLKATSHASSKKIMAFYDNKIKRYFHFKNITPKRVGKSVRAYNRKWKYRNFKLLKFKILKRYTKNGVNYCNIRTSTKWYVSNHKGKKSSGYSKGFMTIKDTKRGFKVKAIYVIK